MRPEKPESESSIRIRSGPGAGRPLEWTRERLIAAALEWRGRHGRLPRASDWSTAKGRGHEPERRARIDDPPPGAPRWPPASTINEAFGSWANFRIHCTGARPPAPVATASVRGDAKHRELVVHGDAAIVEDLQQRWQALETRYLLDAEADFVLWAIRNGYATLRDADERLAGTHAAECERLLWRRLTSADKVALIFATESIADANPSKDQLTLVGPARQFRRRLPRSQAGDLGSLALETSASSRNHGLVEPRDAFAANLRKRRASAGLSQEALGKASGMHFTEISRLERSERDPRLATIVKLARALNVSTSELLVGVD